MTARRVSPIIGLDGQHFVSDSFQSSYEGAKQSPRTRYWHAPATGPNSALRNTLSTLRNRTRAAYRNMPLIYSGIEKNTINEVGTGVTLRSTATNDVFREQMNVLWKRWVKQADPEGIMDFNGLQSQTVRGRRTAGEVFIRMRPRSLSDALAIPFQLQVLESDFVPQDLNQKRANGNTIRQGVEFNRRGRRVAYWMYKSHPGEYADTPDAGQLLRIPASQVIHHYLPTRPGQIRGEPDPVQSLLKAYTFDSYDDAELTRKQTRSPLTGAIYRDQDVTEDDFLFDPITGQPLDPENGDMPEAHVDPGTFLNLLPTERIEVFSGDNTGQGYNDFMSWQSKLIAIGQNIPYELLTGDWKNVNDRLLRGVLNEYRRGIEMAQDHLLIFQVCRNAWLWGVKAAISSGAISVPGDFFQNKVDYFAHEARPQGWKYNSPEQDVKAKALAVKEGLTSQLRVCAEDGQDADEVAKEQADYERRKMKYRDGLPETTSTASQTEPEINKDDD